MAQEQKIGVLHFMCYLIVLQAESCSWLPDSRNASSTRYRFSFFSSQQNFNTSLHMSEKRKFCRLKISETIFAQWYNKNRNTSEITTRGKPDFFKKERFRIYLLLHKQYRCSTDNRLFRPQSRIDCKSRPTLKEVEYIYSGDRHNLSP